MAIVVPRFCIDTLHKVIHVESNSMPPYILITDYSYQGDMLLKVVLSRKQIPAVQEIEEGSFCTICKLRLQELPGTGRYRGRLGGDERLIFKLDPRNIERPEIRQLLRFVNILSLIAERNVSR